MDDGEIKWFLNGEVYAETIITNYMRYVKVVPYLAMYHVEDVVNVNAWWWFFLGNIPIFSLLRMFDLHFLLCFILFLFTKRSWIAEKNVL